MLDLTSRAGIPVLLQPDMLLRFGPDLPAVQPAVRSRGEVAAVGYLDAGGGASDSGAADARAGAAGAPDEPLYWMYRAVERPADRRAWEGGGLRYDITVLRPGAMAGGELVKTVGHYHPNAPGASITYPEIYAVLHGRAIYLLQRVDLPGSRVLDLALIEAGPGDIVLIPPGYGHITVNAGTEPLVMANCVERTFRSVYEPVAAARGGAVYLLAADAAGVAAADASEAGSADTPEAAGASGRAHGAAGGVTIVPNPRYRDVPTVTVQRAGENPAFALPLRRPLYTAVVERPAEFGFCVRPHERWPA